MSAPTFEVEPPDAEDLDGAAEEVVRPVVRNFHQSPAQPVVSAGDQTGLAFWRTLNEAEQNWLLQSGDTARGLIRWASRLSREAKVLKIRAFSGAGDDRRQIIASSFRYVAVEEDELIFWFTLTPDSIPPELEMGTPVEIEYGDGESRKVLSALARPATKFPYPALVFFPDDGQA